MLICDCTSASVTMSFIIIPWRADSRQCIHTYIDFAYAGGIVKFIVAQSTG